MSTFSGGITGVEFSALYLLGMHSTTWTIPSALFLLAMIFEIGSHFIPELTCHYSPICASPHSWYNRHCHSIQPLVETGLMNFLFKLSSNCYPPDLYLPSILDYRLELLCPADRWVLLTGGRLKFVGRNACSFLKTRMIAISSPYLLHPKQCVTLRRQRIRKRKVYG
jgi:hypothetical protein